MAHLEEADRRVAAAQQAAERVWSGELSTDAAGAIWRLLEVSRRHMRAVVA